MQALSAKTQAGAASAPRKQVASSRRALQQRVVPRAALDATLAVGGIASMVGLAGILVATDPQKRCVRAPGSRARQDLVRHGARPASGASVGGGGGANWTHAGDFCSVWDLCEGEARACLASRAAAAAAACSLPPPPHTPSAPSHGRAPIPAPSGQPHPHPDQELTNPKPKTQNKKQTNKKQQTNEQTKNNTAVRHRWRRPAATSSRP